MIGFQNPGILLLLLLIGFLSWKAYKLNGFKRKVGFINISVAILLVLAAAGPQISFNQEDDLRPSITVIEETSESSSLIEDWERSADSADLNVRTVNSDDSNFEAQMRGLTDSGEEYLFVSDLQFDSELPQYFSQNNVSMNLLTPEIRDEASVRIEGPDQTVIGAENSFTVEVESSNDLSPEAEIRLGNTTVESGETPLEIDLSFEEEGIKELSAEIDSQDEFEENNKYYKTVRVLEKPEVASIGPESGLEDEFSNFYDVNSYDNLPNEIENYQSVIMKESADSQELRDYLVDGGGLMYTGSDYSSDYLPVAPSDKDDQTDAPLLVFLLDISQNMACASSFCGAGEDTGDIDAENMASSMLIANQIINGLPDNARVSILPYAERAYVGEINQPVTLASNRERILHGISSLEPQNEISRHERGLREADNILSRNEGDGNVVMISNGRISPSLNRDIAISEAGIESRTLDGRLITVGVTNELEDLREEDETFLRDLAESTQDGFYIDGRNPNLDITFDAGGGSSEMQPLVVSDSNHFITEGYSPNASVFEVDGSRPRTSASQLVSTASGEPVLTSTRYGLGRVAAFTADNRDLEALMDQDPALVGRTMSWVSGPLERELWVEGSRIGDDFRVISTNRVPGFSRQSNNRYTQQITPEGTGFHEAENMSYSVNYRPEIENVGYNEEMFSSFTHQGNVYDEENVNVLFEDMDYEVIETSEEHDLTPYLVGLALLMYLGFVGLRKRNGLA